uniref:Uncharacterized protein n=1 Tax=Sphaerodactylus townsendi TaxID=933632 RepID=A0ACB8FS56_9SAUR
MTGASPPGLLLWDSPPLSPDSCTSWPRTTPPSSRTQHHGRTAAAWWRLHHYPGARLVLWSRILGHFATGHHAIFSGPDEHTPPTANAAWLQTGSAVALSAHYHLTRAAIAGHTPTAAAAFLPRRTAIAHRAGAGGPTRTAFWTQPSGPRFTSGSSAC